MAIILAAVLAAQAATPTLWENVTAGMSAAEVRALYPAGAQVRHVGDRVTIRDHQVSADCRAEVHIVHHGGSVSGIVMRGEPAIAARCGTAVLEQLALRYGPPLSEETGRPSILKRVRTTYVWRTGDLYIRYVRFDTQGWGGAGLGNASWEMTLSTSPEPVRL